MASESASPSCPSRSSGVLPTDGLFQLLLAETSHSNPVHHGGQRGPCTFGVESMDLRVYAEGGGCAVGDAGTDTAIPASGAAHSGWDNHGALSSPFAARDDNPATTGTLQMRRLEGGARVPRVFATDFRAIEDASQTLSVSILQSLAGTSQCPPGSSPATRGVPEDFPLASTDPSQRDFVFIEHTAFPVAPPSLLQLRRRDVVFPLPEVVAAPTGASSPRTELPAAVTDNPYRRMRAQSFHVPNKLAADALQRAASDGTCDSGSAHSTPMADTRAARYNMSPIIISRKLFPRHHQSSPILTETDSPVTMISTIGLGLQAIASPVEAPPQFSPLRRGSTVVDAASSAGCAAVLGLTGDPSQAADDEMAAAAAATVTGSSCSASVVETANSSPLSTTMAQIDASTPTVTVLVPDTATQAWKRGALIGEGSFGKVYRCLNIATGEICAMKELPLFALNAVSTEDQARFTKQLQMEIQVLSVLEHKNIVRCFGVSEQLSSVNIMMEYINGGSLRSVLDEFGPLEDPVMAWYTKQVLEGLSYLHSMNIVHGDVKCANALVLASSVVKLTDFGCCRVCGDEASCLPGPAGGDFKPLSGTVPFMAPEVIRQRGCTFKSDVWSLGCLVVEMASGGTPWSQFSNKLSAMYHVASTDEVPDIPTHVTPACKAFLSRCFQRDPDERASATELLAHVWLEGIAAPVSA